MGLFGKKKSAEYWYIEGNRSSAAVIESDKAIKCYDKAIEIDPNHSGAWFGKATSLKYLRRYDEAIKCFEKAIEIEPNYAAAWFGKATSLDSLDGFDEALDSLDGSDEALDSFDRSDEAIKCYNKVIEIEPNNQFYLQQIQYREFNTYTDPSDKAVPASVSVICNSCHGHSYFPPASNFCKSCKSDLRQHKILNS